MGRGTLDSRKPELDRPLSCGWNSRGVIGIDKTDSGLVSLVAHAMDHMTYDLEEAMYDASFRFSLLPP